MARRNTKNQTTKAQAEVRRQRCLELRVAGLSCAQIGREVGIDESTAARHVREALAELATMKLDDAEHLRELELARIDKLIRSAERILARHHVKVSGGNVVRDLDPATGQLVVIEDDGPAMTAIGRLQSLYESRRKLLGLDAPAKVEQSGEVKVVVTYEDESPG
jgi:hypothetical protein